MLSEQVGKFHVQLRDERAEREQAQAQMLRILDEIHLKLDDQLE
jgi:hypothetical protein